MSDNTAGNRAQVSGAASEGSGQRPSRGKESGDGGGRASEGGRVDPGSRGRTTIADGVVEKIAGLAAREVVGVHALGSGMARTFGAVRDRVPGAGPAVARGVKAEVGEAQTALDLEIIIEYGVAIGDVARTVREHVISGVERMTGLEVVEVNLAISDVKLPDEEDEDESESEGANRSPLR